jgi:LCP family protein required for cell wall assembly
MIVRSVLAKAAYGVCCVAAAATLVVSHSVNKLVSDIQSIGGSDAITSGPSTGPMNILLMGLESRTDYDGVELDHHLIHVMHTGSNGGQDTNTLILIHIFNGGQKAVGFSIPRDDWVTYPHTWDGQSEGKIDQAYGDAWAQSLNQTANDTSMSRDTRYYQANVAGQKAAIETVESVTGVHIDHFAEVNLLGFYELANAFGGIEACLKSWNGGQNLHDANSGFNVSKPGYVHLDAAQALAFVRERDNLPQGDLDRTHRQQAVVDYVMWKVRHEGILTSYNQLTQLMGIAKQYIITDKGWDLLTFSTEMKALTGKNMTFYTAPVVTTDGHMAGQDVNIINVATIQQTIKNAFYPPPPAPKHKTPAKSAPSYPLSDSVVDVYNAGYTPHLARDVSQGLVSAGFKQGQVAQASSNQSTTQVLYGSGAAAKANATKVASLFSVTAAASSSVSAGHVEVILGSSATLPSSFASLTSPSPSTSSSSSSSSGSSGSSGSTNSPGPGNDGQSGGAVSVSGSAPYGIPCVY